MSICDKTSNNKYFNCPPRMSDGRHFTDYRPNCYVNNLLRYNNRTMSSYEYRQFLTQNAENLMKINNMYSSQKNSCEPCNAQQINNQTKCNYNKSYGTCNVNDCNGIGLTNNAGKSLNNMQYNPGLQVEGMSNPNYSENKCSPAYVEYAAMPGKQAQSRCMDSYYGN